MNCVVFGRRVVLEDYNPNEVLCLKNGLSIKHPKEWLLRQQRPYLNDPEKPWDGRIHWLKEKHGQWSFPFGFLERARECIETAGGDFFVTQRHTDTPVKPVYDLVGGIVLDPIQREALEALLSKRSGGTVQLSTGSGKTYLTAALANSWLNRDEPWGKVLVLVPKKLLLKQTAKSLSECLPWKVGMLGDGHRDFDADVLVATPNTASAPDRVNGSDEILKFLNKNVSAVVIDECHRSTSTMWQEAIENAELTEATWAMSGKVKYLDNKQQEMTIESYLGKPVFTGRNSKRLVPVTVRFYRHGAPKLPPHVTAQLYDNCICKVWVNNRWVPAVYRGKDAEGAVKDDLLDSDGNPDNSKFGIWTFPSKDIQSTRIDPQPKRNDIIYQTAHDAGIAVNSVRNKWAIDLALDVSTGGSGRSMPTGPCLITVKRMRHAVELTQKLSLLRPTCMVSGSLTGDQQQRLIREFNDYKYPIMVAVAGVISEGVDMPNLLHVIKLDGLSGEQGLEQLKGRVERSAPGKTQGYLHIPDDMHHPALRKASNFMKKYYKAGGLKVV